MMETVVQIEPSNITVTTDTSGNWGYGAYWSEVKKWIQCPWQGAWQEDSRVCKKYCDNMAVVNIVVKKSSHDKLVMHDTATKLALGKLADVANNIISNSIAASSRKTYSSAQNRYLKFCSQMQLAPMPATQQQLILFAADLSQTLAYSTMRTYLSAVRHMHISEGLKDPLEGALQLELLLRGARRNKPARKDQRLPITP